MVDTVERAMTTPDVVQPYRDLGLADDEYDRIRAILGRRPTAAELAMYSVMWSEHCSYKSSKVHLRQFGEKTTDEMRARLLVGIGENAGVVDIGDGWAITFKIESHNHPSFVEPYQGAATGVGGIVRDIMSMGARPIAVMDQLRFGAVDHPDTARVLPGVVAGVGGYGNCLGLPNIGGEVVFDPSYQGNPLVNALCVGKLRHDQIHLASARGVGNLVVLFGARTGGDGIGGVSVLASETFDEGGPTKRPSVQVGDPFAEKVLIECCLDLFAAGVVAGIQDLGGAGLSCATSELASNGDGGMLVHLDRVPLRDATLRPEEILMSESQERMMAVVRPGDLDAFLTVTARWDVEATVLGEVTDTGRLVVVWHGETVVDVPPRTVAHEGPVYHRPYARPAVLDARQADTPDHLPRPSVGEDLRALVLRMTASANLCSRAWVTDQYDRYVMGDTALAMPDDAGVVRVDDETGLGVAVATDCNGRFGALDPYEGARLALAEAYRNVATVGARPLAVTDCLNFGSPQDPGVMWQFERAVTGLADGCRELARARHRGQRQLLQPDRRGRDPPDAGRGGSRGDRRRRPPGAVGVAHGGPRAAASRRDPGGARRLGVGLGGAPAPGRPAAGVRPRRRGPPGARAAGRARRGTAGGGARPVRRRARPGRGRGLPALRGGGAPGPHRRVRARRGGRLRRAVLGVRGARAGRRAAGARGADGRDRRGRGPAGRGGRRVGWARARGRGGVRDPRGRAGRGPHRDVACRLRALRPPASLGRHGRPRSGNEYITVEPPLLCYPRRRSYGVDSAV